MEGARPSRAEAGVRDRRGGLGKSGSSLCRRRWVRGLRISKSFLPDQAIPRPLPQDSPMQSGMRCVYPLSIFGMPDSIVRFFFWPAFCAALPSALLSSPGPLRPAPDAVRLCPAPAAPSIPDMLDVLMIGFGFVFAMDSTLGFVTNRDGPADESARSSLVMVLLSACVEPTGLSQYLAYGLTFRAGAVVVGGGGTEERIFGFVSVDTAAGASDRIVSSGCTTSTYGRKYWLTCAPR